MDSSKTNGSITPEHNQEDLKIPSTIKFHYIKSNLFRVIHADGGIGGVTPQQNIQIAFYSERMPLPQQVVYELNSDNTLGSEVVDERVSKTGLIRELEVEAVLSLNEAESFYKWLGENIKKAKKLRRSVTKKEKST